jgi:hypothetical protein
VAGIDIGLRCTAPADLGGSEKFIVLAENERNILDETVFRGVVVVRRRVDQDGDV